MNVKPIETHYNGYRFRSRLEARWAIFFDTLGIKWEYEPEGYRMSDGTCYLPDFWLPTFCGGMYVEVKPDGGDFTKAIKFAKESEQAMWLAEGVPAARIYQIAKCFDGDVLILVGCPLIDQAVGEDRMFWWPGYENADGTIDPEMCGDRYMLAVRRAKTARFEHGEAL